MSLLIIGGTGTLGQNRFASSYERLPGTLSSSTLES
jgi:hypothetical protein